MMSDLFFLSVFALVLFMILGFFIGYVKHKFDYLEYLILEFGGEE